MDIGWLNTEALSINLSFTQKNGGRACWKWKNLLTVQEETFFSVINECLDLHQFNSPIAIPNWPKSINIINYKSNSFSGIGMIKNLRIDNKWFQVNEAKNQSLKNKIELQQKYFILLIDVKEYANRSVYMFYL